MARPGLVADVLLIDVRPNARQVRGDVAGVGADQVMRLARNAPTGVAAEAAAGFRPAAC